MSIRHFLLALSIVCLSAGRASAVSIGLIDTFEDGTTANWRINLLGMGNNTFQPVNVPSGGPAGVDDNFMLMSSSGLPGPGGRLVALNPAQWAGDYVAAGIMQISMDVNNLGNTDLFLRLLFEDPMGAPPENEAFTTSVFLPAGSGWTSISFLVDPGSLIVEEGSALAALQNTTILRIFSNPDAEGPDEAEPIAAMLGVDNIEAVAVPEPSSLILLTTGVAAVYRRSRRRRD
jgi:PEP-CTERM motif-containing protein